MSAAPASSTARVPLWSARAHGPLPSMLLVLTILSGVVDAISILALGRVFVANMTGNAVFIVFAAAGAPGFSLSASLFALGGFLVGASIGGMLIARTAGNRAVLLRDGVIMELLLAAVCLGAIASANGHVDATHKDLVAALLAVAMGIQNAVARKLAVPDITTTVLTMTLTGIAADLRSANRGPALTRRFLAVAAMLAGAATGAELVLHGAITAALGIAVGLLAVVSLAALRSAKRPGAWQHAPEH